MPAIALSQQQLEPQALPPMDRDEESGYASANSSDSSVPDVFFTKPHLTFLNRQLQHLEPQGGRVYPSQTIFQY